MKSIRSACRNVFGGGLAVVAIVILSGCGGNKTASDDGLSLLKINGNTVLTDKGLHQELGAMVGNKMDPALLPKATKRKVLDDLARFEVTVEAARREGIANDPEFKKAFEVQKDRLEKIALVKFYDKKKFEEVQVGDVEAKKYFDDNKARFVKEQGGVLVSGIGFGNRDKALAFYDKVKGKKRAEDFASVGKKEKDGKFREFGRVGAAVAQSQGYNFVPGAIKEAAKKLVKLPAVDVVKDGKQTWVIHVSDKKESVLYEYVAIAEQVKNQLKINKFMEVRNKLYDELKKQFTIEINEDYFKEPAAPEQEGIAAPTKDSKGTEGK